METPLLSAGNDVEAGLGISLTWHNVNCSVLDPEYTGKTKCFKQILYEVSGHVHVGELLAVMGPSGAGKTTLLNILADRPSLGQDGIWTGQVLLNDMPRWQKWQRHLGYVMQKDIFFEELTVYETLRFTAMLKMPYDLPEFEKERVVEDTIKQLGLDSVVSTKIGSQVERGLSGGELKRVNIATELLGDPSLLLLDEPLTGLDSARAIQVMKLLQQTAKAQGRTVLLTIHQPSSQIYQLFDKLMLMAPGGRTVFFGDVKSAADHFAWLGYTCPLHWVPTDFFIDLVSDGATALYLATHHELQHPSSRDASTSETHSSLTTPTAADNRLLPRAALPFHYSTRVLMRRGFKQTKGVYLQKMEWLMIAALAVTWGGLWWDVGGHARSRMNDYIGIIFFFIAHWSWYSLFQGLGAFPAQRNVLTKERASETYSIESFFVAKVLCEIPIIMVLPAFFFAICFPMVAFPLKTCIPLYLVTLLTVQVAASLSMVISVALFDEKAAGTAAIITMVFEMCAGGYFIDMSGIGWLGNLRYASYWYYALGLFFDIAVLPYGEVARESTEQYSFSTLGNTWNIIILAAIVAGLRLLAYTVLRRTKKLTFR
ncbi:hypothetical protein CYMTET_41151 [Cymbomonas tetramitiformis]|uniref:ABC transporter domain-containing protein n=1 Tax=Cymbomonas tetramitiformis TaxID=36881 RepID=A0AAE0C6M5_9CHLO|nr:hypothetical protein CYMTET_41151 [Cymbomonas tetramitiformis]|eukprot:gene16649-19779_t